MSKEQSFKLNPHMFRGRTFQAEDTDTAKYLKQEQTWYSPGTERRSVESGNGKLWKCG